MSTTTSKRDERVADDAANDRLLACTASGCPRRWSCNFGSRLCSAHDAAPPDRWPEVTQSLLDADADTARFGAKPAPAPRVATREEGRAALARLRRPPREGRDLAWAQRLEQREARGDDLTDFQRSAWRAALHGPIVGAAE